MDYVNSLVLQSQLHGQENEVQMNFCPDLIVEVTSICDRACSGCYALNIVSKKSKMAVYEQFQNLFLDSTVFSARLGEIADSAQTISFRGGEPTRHPFLSRLLELTADKTDSKIYLETHGRWVLDETEGELLESFVLC